MAKLTAKQIRDLASKGRGRDSIVAHINPEEAELLKAHGGSGAINPETGLPEFNFFSRLNPFSYSNDIGGQTVQAFANFDDSARGFVGGVLSAPQKAWNEASKTLAGFDDAANKVAKQLGATVSAIASDPKKLAMIAIAIYYPGAALEIGNSILGSTLATQYPLLASTVGQTVLNTAANGGDIGGAAYNAIIQNGSVQIANTIGARLPEASSNVQKVFNNFATRAATDVTVAALTGKDPTSALLMGGASAATNVILNEYGSTIGYKELPVEAKNAISSALTATLAGKDVSPALVNSAISSAIYRAGKFAAFQKEVAASDTLARANIKNLTAEQLKAVKGDDIYSSTPIIYKDFGYANQIVKVLEFGANKNVSIPPESLTNLTSGQIINLDILDKLYDKSNKYGFTITPEVINNLTNELNNTYSGFGPDTSGYKTENDALTRIDNLYSLANKNDFRVTDDLLYKVTYPGERINFETYGDREDFFIEPSYDINQLANQADATQTSSNESRDFLKGVLGRDPSDAEVAQFVGERPEADTLNNQNAYDTLVGFFEKSEKSTGAINDLKNAINNSNGSNEDKRRLIEELNGYQEAGLAQKYDFGKIPLEGGGGGYGGVTKVGKSPFASNDPNISKFLEKNPDLIPKINNSFKALKDSGFKINSDYGYMQNLISIFSDPNTNLSNEQNDEILRGAIDLANQGMASDKPSEYLNSINNLLNSNKVISPDLRYDFVDSGRKLLESYPELQTQANKELYDYDAWKSTIPTVAAPAANKPLQWDPETQSYKEIPTWSKVANVTADNQTSSNEVKEMFESIGYKPTPREIERFVKAQSEKLTYEDLVKYVQYFAPVEDPLPQPKPVTTPVTTPATTPATTPQPEPQPKPVTKPATTPQPEPQPVTSPVTSPQPVTSPVTTPISPISGQPPVLPPVSEPPVSPPAPIDDSAKIAAEILAAKVAAEKLADKIAADKLAAKVAAEKAAAKVAAEKAAKIAAVKNAKLQQFISGIVEGEGAGAQAIAPEPIPVVEAAPYFDIGKPLDIGFFDRQAAAKKDTQTQQGVVKIAEGGYMNVLFPQEEVSMDEILRILEGR